MMIKAGNSDKKIQSLNGQAKAQRKVQCRYSFFEDIYNQNAFNNNFQENIEQMRIMLGRTEKQPKSEN